MKAAVFEAFGGPITVRELGAPEPHADAVLVRVRACGVCRSDWHAWKGHDDGVRVPHVPGHELSGSIAAVGERVSGWQVGQRVTAPFCCGCGVCLQCTRGDLQVCPQQTQPGFTHWGAFAELVEIRHADANLIALPDAVDDVTAASLGCRFATSFRALVQQGRLRGGEWLAVHGCGGVGLSAVMIGKALGARVIAVDVKPERLLKARSLGADEVVDASRYADSSGVIDALRAISGGGVHLSMDALGSKTTCWNSVCCLAPRGRHVQVGLLLGTEANPSVPMGPVIANELEILGSHGMAAHEYPEMLQMIASGALSPGALVSDVVSLEAGAELLMQLDEFPHAGISVIEMD